MGSLVLCRRLCIWQLKEVIRRWYNCSWSGRHRWRCEIAWCEIPYIMLLGFFRGSKMFGSFVLGRRNTANGVKSQIALGRSPIYASYRWVCIKLINSFTIYFDFVTTSTSKSLGWALMWFILGLRFLILDSPVKKWPIKLCIFPELTGLLNTGIEYLRTIVRTSPLFSSTCFKQKTAVSF